MTAFDTQDAVRSLPSTALLQHFFFGDAARVLADCDGSLVAVLKRPAVSARQRALLAGVELARRAALEEVGARTVMTAPRAVLDFLRLHFLACEEERFAALWLDAQNRLIAFDELFRGTLTQTSELISDGPIVH